MATMIGSAVAAVIATYSAWSQGSNQRRLARIAFFEQRLEVFTLVHELAAATHDLASMATSGPGDELWDRVFKRTGRALTVVETQAHRIHFLFGDDVEDYVKRLKGAATAIQAAAMTYRIKMAEDSVEDDPFIAAALSRVAQARPRAFAAFRELRDAFAPYLANDRTFGLNPEARRLASRDPVLRPQEPYRPGSRV